MMNALCVITARGGSKRIPRKNVREFCGRPIIAYSIGAALESGLFGEVMVSTDDDQIAGVARACGAEVPFLRSATASDDFATTADVLDAYEARGRSFDVVSCIYPTAPFVTAERLREGWELLSGGFDSVQVVTAYSFPPQRGVLRDAAGGICWWQPEHRDARSQDLPIVYHDTGQFYWLRPEALRDDRSLVCGKAGALVVPESAAQDIDNEDDWQTAELKFRRMRGNA